MVRTDRRAEKRPPRTSAVRTEKKLRRFPFTLIELVAVILVVMVTLSVTSVALRSKTSDAKKLEERARELSNFFSRVRINAAETGEEHIVFYLPESNELAALFSVSEEEENEEELENEELLELRAKKRKSLSGLRWKIPEDLTLLVNEVDITNYVPGQNRNVRGGETAVDAVGPDDEELDRSRAGEESGGVELLRVYPDGGCGGERKFVLTGGDESQSKLYFLLSRLTGMSSVSETDPDEQNGFQ